MKKLFITLIIFSVCNIMYCYNLSEHSVLCNLNNYKTTDCHSLKLFDIAINNSTIGIKTPTVPTNITYTNVTQTSCTLSWTPSTDNVGVFGYEIYRNGTYYGATTSTSINITGLSCNTSYNFTVNAFDSAQPANISAFSVPRNVITLGCATNNTEIVSAPSTIGQNSTNELRITYSSAQAGRIWAGLFDSSWNYIGGSSDYAVNANTSGTVSINSTVTNVPVGTGYKWYVELADSNDATIDGTARVQENVTVLSATNTDTPTVPANVTETNVTQTSCTLSWTPSTDNVGVVGYEIYRNGAYYVATTLTSINITGLSCNTSYNFTVNAFDGAQPVNISAFSAPRNVITLGCGTNTAPAHLKYFGYFIVDTEWPATSTSNNYTSEVAGFTNLNQMAAYFPSQNLVSRINSMNQQCSLPFLSLQGLFYYEIDNNAPSGHHYVLFSDYRARWDEFKRINGSVLTPSKIGAFYMLDEPVWNGVTFGDLNAVSEMVKGDYPTIPILLVEAYNQIVNMQVPTSVDWLGFDRYFMFNPSTNASYLQNLADLKSKRSSANQKIFIVADNNWIPSYGTAGQTAANMDIVIQDYYNLAASDSDIIGMLAWVWPSGFDETSQIGARDLPQNVKDKNMEIGNKIKANFNPCNIASIEGKNRLGTDKNFEIKLYPNPASGNVSIEYNLVENGTVNIQIYDMVGERLINQDLNENLGNKIFNIDTRNLKNGIYLVKVITSKYQSSKQLIIKNN